MDNAKSLEIFKYLHRAGKTCTTQAMDNACLKGDLDFVKFIHYNRTEGCSESAIINACTTGNFDLIKFLISIRKEVCSSAAVDDAIQSNCRLEIIKFLDKGCTISGLNYAMQNNRLDIIQYLHQRFPKSPRIWTPVTLNVATMTGHLDIVKYIHENRTEESTTNAMNYAAKYDHLDVLKFLHFNRTEGCTTNAMDFSTDLEVIKFLHFNRTEGATTKCMDNAARRGDIETVEWLHKNRSEGCTDQALWESNNNPDIYNYILSSKIIPVRSIKNCQKKKKKDYYEIYHLINKYYNGI
ncbi:hypothetical protein DFA_04195 [Cavenderia fasciculata]|uniref:Ankyrin repeat-containing protein n=1 Tax=Cavenderia fasciculata TaxID=261658 RepID=F4Q1J8_CACFS|nr:uncharacterized protein DFA_04195 [Cavenderia fasciculata]EGG18699.1 hypothetical protein DFA_04195 [Cavenderia fasciculata]|eukprot:XP_004366603.1 hypothetical protein DFA_04195 [Cavenderia fasciculata]